MSHANLYMLEDCFYRVIIVKRPNDYIIPRKKFISFISVMMSIFLQVKWWRLLKALHQLLLKRALKQKITIHISQRASAAGLI